MAVRTTLSDRARIMPASPIRRLAPLAAAARKAGKTIYALNIGQPDIATPRAILDRLRSYDAAFIPYGPSQGLPEFIEALRAYYKQHYPDTVLPKTTDEQIAWLVGREPVPEARLAALVERRLDATRENLVGGQGIAETRVVAAEVRPPAAPVDGGQGRVEFTIVAADG